MRYKLLALLTIVSIMFLTSCLGGGESKNSDHTSDSEKESEEVIDNSQDDSQESNDESGEDETENGKGGGTIVYMEDGVEIIADIPSGRDVEIGEYFTFSTAALQVGGAVYSNPRVTVKYDGDSVQTEGSSFLVEQKGDYNVEFAFVDAGSKYVYKIVVTGVDTTPPSIFIEGTLNGKYAFGETVTLPKFKASDLSGETPDVSVKIFENNDDRKQITPFSGIFEVESYDGYEIVAEAVDSSGNQASKQYYIIVNAHNEFEYFNQKDYVLTALTPSGGGKLAYNADEKYIFEGQGSLEFYTDINGKWIGFWFDKYENFDWSSIKSLSFWVYNPTENTYDIQFMLSAGRNPSQVENCSRTALLPSVWTKITIDKTILLNAQSSLGERYDEDVYAFVFFNGGDYLDNYQDFNVYLDCFRLEFDDDEPSVKLNELKDVVFKPSDEQTQYSVKVAELDSLYENLNSDNVTVTAYKDGESFEVIFDNGSYYLKTNQRGKYIVNYVYKSVDGEDGDSVFHTVIVSKSYPDPTFDGFEYDEDVGALEKQLAYGNGEFSISTDIKHDGEKSLKYENGLWSRYSYVVLGLDDDMLATIDYESEVSVWLYVEKGLFDGNGFNLRVRNWAKNEANQVGSTWYFYADNCNFGEWTQIVISGNEQIDALKSDGGIWIWVELLGGSNDFRYNMYIDDIKVTHIEPEVFDGTFESNRKMTEDIAKITNGKATISLSNNIVRSGQKSLEIKNDVDGRYTCFAIIFDESTVEKIQSSSFTSIKISVYLDTGSYNGGYFNTRFATYKEGDPDGGFGEWLAGAENNVGVGQWLEFELTPSETTRERLKTNPALWIRFETDPTVNNYAWVAYVDDIIVTNEIE